MYCPPLSNFLVRSCEDSLKKGNIPSEWPKTWPILAIMAVGLNVCVDFSSETHVLTLNVFEGPYFVSSVKI